jgi:hypothetical protein
MGVMQSCTQSYPPSERTATRGAVAKSVVAPTTL